MSDFLVYGALVGFFLAVFPVHIYNYVYVNTNEKYASVNVCAFRFIRLFNANTVKDSPRKMQVNGKEKDINLSAVKKNALKIFNNLCITRIVQLEDFGMQSEYNAYAAILHSVATNALYAFVRINGGRTKLRNYTVLNMEHGYINYYMKAVGVINLMTVAKILFVLFTEKLNENKA